MRPVLDIYTAYEILTGATLPRAPDARLPHVSLEAQRQVQKKIDAWYKLYSTALDAYTKMPGQAKLSQECVDLYKQGLDIIQHAQKMAAEGEVSAAFWDHVHAAIYAYLALEAGRYRTAYADGGYSGAVKRVRNNDWLEKEIATNGRPDARRNSEDFRSIVDVLPCLRRLFGSARPAVFGEGTAGKIAGRRNRRRQCAGHAGRQLSNHLLAGPEGGGRLSGLGRRLRRHAAAAARGLARHRRFPAPRLGSQQQRVRRPDHQGRGQSRSLGRRADIATI